MLDIDFRSIVPRRGSQWEAFEDLCCLLAHRAFPEASSFSRLHGAGGDGGVECIAHLPDGTCIGWQAKYVFNVDSLLRQATRSLRTSQDVHPEITRYVICFPINLTGPTARRGRSGTEKFEAWREKQNSGDRADRLAIEAWSAFDISELLLKHDGSGGIRRFFFDKAILTPEWFKAHLKTAEDIAGPRYNPKLNVETNLWKWFAAFGRTAAWASEFTEKIDACWEPYERVNLRVNRSEPHPMAPAWPEDLRANSKEIADEIGSIYDTCRQVITREDKNVYKYCVSKLEEILPKLADLESKLIDNLEAKYPDKFTDTPHFRQITAELTGSFPAANLDDTRKLNRALRDLHDWLRSPSCSLSCERAFVLSGMAGSGKTHGACDTASIRLGESLLTCVVFGHQFGGEPDPWTRLLETLGLPMSLGRDGLLDVLDTAGETSGYPVILFIDAINETRPQRYWRDQLQAVIHAARLRPHLRVGVACRTSYTPYCLPDGHELPIVEHTGFAGIEREACRAFCEYYGLESPITPYLQPELSNPLYLRLACETFSARGLRRLPTGWQSFAPTVRAYLEEKERKFAAEYETGTGSSIVVSSLRAIARAIADSGESALPRSEADRVIAAVRPQAHNLRVVEWLIGNDLIIADVPTSGDMLDMEEIVRPGFERLGDFLIATELLDRCGPTGLEYSFQEGGEFHVLVKDSHALGHNEGVLSVLSVLVPEQHPGMEIPDLGVDVAPRESLIRITVQSFPSRDPETFTVASQTLIREALAQEELSFDAMDAVLASSWRPSPIDGIWLHEILSRQTMAERDPYWCSYLHDRYERKTTVYRLIEAAFELPLEKLEPGLAERWATVLLWFTAAADRRVKDKATRAATAVLAAHPKVIRSVLPRLLESDDDEVRHRLLLSSYGALILSRDTEECRFIAGTLQSAFEDDPGAFGNAMLRDCIRCICELAQTIGVSSEDIDPELTMNPMSSPWPLNIPPDDQVKRWGKSLHFQPNEFASDFFKYSMYRLRPWEEGIPKVDMAKWMIGQIATEFGYEHSDCENYDGYMLGTYGGGRAKPTWAERIGKKYQWISMYQLASRLQDHVERRRENWQPEPLRTPLILLQGRQLDPTLPPNTDGGSTESNPWWIRASADLDLSHSLANAEWVKSRKGIPDLRDLLAVVNQQGQGWRPLFSYAEWTEPQEEGRTNTPHRQVWVHVRGYLVPQQKTDTAYKALLGANFFGGWMPEGVSWPYGFAGEYPWATPFNTEPEDWHSYSRPAERELPVTVIPSWNEPIAEWEYDASLPRNFHMAVPARIFFSQGDLWWNGSDGYRFVHGRTIFRDPSIVASGPRSLLADCAELEARLDKLGLGLVWTLLGEKWILGGRFERTPSQTFSQVGYMNRDGSLNIGERVFFEY